MIHPILKLLSHSSILLLHSCPRKYQLRKLRNLPLEESDDLTYGSAIGHGIQQLLLGRSMQDVWLEIFVKWNMDILDDDEKTQRKRKTLWHAFHTLNIFEGRYKQIILDEYEVASFNGKPAVELSFRLALGNGFFYRGFVDVVLIHRQTRQLVVLEIKTTASKYVSPARFQNSGQGLGYSVVCDYIARGRNDVEGSHYKVFYLVFKSTAEEFEPFHFPKSYSQRAIWIKQLLQEVEHIIGYDKDGLWPMYGESCEAWGRACEFLGVCNLSDESILVGTVPEPREEPDFTFEISLMDLINAQLDRNQEAIVL